MKVDACKCAQCSYFALYGLIVSHIGVLEKHAKHALRSIMHDNIAAPFRQKLLNISSVQNGHISVNVIIYHSVRIVNGVVYVRNLYLSHLVEII